MRYFRDMENDEGIRINKYFTQVGYCSRRAADKLIDAGAVKTAASTDPDLEPLRKCLDEMRQ